jgi:response regulator RpfG family c-di-GMP phosphodiesterase
MEGRRNVLVVEVDADRFKAIAPMIDRKQFEVDRFPGAKGALELVSLVPFRAIILGFPMREVSLNDFLYTIKSSSSACRSSPIALITDDQHLQDANAYVKRGVNLVTSYEQAPKKVENQLCEMLGIKSRFDFRAMVTLNVTIESARKERFVAQTKDISASGMFVLSNRECPVGSTAFFEFALPNEPKPFCGEAKVVRVANPSGNRIEGMALQFTSFIRNTQERLQECLREQEA